MLCSPLFSSLQPRCTPSRCDVQPTSNMWIWQGWSLKIKGDWVLTLSSHQHRHRPPTKTSKGERNKILSFTLLYLGSLFCYSLLVYILINTTTICSFCRTLLRNPLTSAWEDYRKIWCRGHCHTKSLAPTKELSAPKWGSSSESYTG